jgi:CheY-like chemotaxis protein
MEVLSSPTAQGFRDARVLVIDDDEIALQAIRDVLEEAGFQVHAMVSPIGATQSITAHGIQAAVIDMNMPLMSGDRLVSLIRSWDRLRDLPVVLISGSSAKTMDEVAHQLPDVPVVTKDSMKRVLVSVVARALSSRVDRGELTTSTQRIRRDQIAATFLKTLPDRVQRIQRGFNQLCAHSAADPEALQDLLATLSAQAQLAALEPVSTLLQTFADVIGMSRGTYSLELQATATTVFAALGSLAEESAGLAAISVELAPALSRLERLSARHG